jgi:hypothetical protein
LTLVRELGMRSSHQRLIAGANLGGSVVPIAFLKSRIEGSSLDVPGSFAFTDITVQPVQLGWHPKRADVVVGYSLFLPTGKWELGGSENSGLGLDVPAHCRLRGQVAGEGGGALEMT